MLSIVWWSAKNNSSQKKTAASAARSCPPLLRVCVFFLFSFFLLSLASTLSVFVFPRLSLGHRSVLRSYRSRKIQCLMPFQQYGQKKAKLAAVSLCSLERSGSVFSLLPHFVSVSLALTKLLSEKIKDVKTFIKVGGQCSGWIHPSPYDWVQYIEFLSATRLLHCFLAWPLTSQSLKKKGISLSRSTFISNKVYMGVVWYVAILTASNSD